MHAILHGYLPASTSRQLLLLVLSSLLLCRLVLPQIFRYLTNLTLREHLLEIVQDIRILIAPERDRYTALARTTRTTNTMRVALDIGGHVEVDDKTDVCDVDTTTREVGGNEDVDAVIFELLKRGFSLVLRLGPVQGDG